eukprot:scaffold1554_cov261-Pinguiococcus_pyrenoidosus.AAC.3
MGYIMGKAEGKEDLWHGHVTAVTVTPEYRRWPSYVCTHSESVAPGLIRADQAGTREKAHAMPGRHHGETM